MSNDHRPKTGPLTPLQRQIILSLMDGNRQIETARELGITPQYVSGEMRIVAAKLKASTSLAAAVTMSRGLAYLEVADHLEKGKVRDPLGEAEEHVNHVLDELAALYRARAAKLIPQ